MTGTRGSPSDSVRVVAGLSASEYGRADGFPILYFHGFPGSRLEASLADGVSKRLGVRLVAFDRPGIGHSTFHRGRSIADIGRNVSDLADALGIRRFAVLGVSGGTPYALACGVLLRERVIRIGLVSPAGPFAEKPYRRALGRWRNAALRFFIVAPSLLRGALRGAVRTAVADPERFVLRTAAHAGSPDREILLAHLPFFADNLKEAFRQGEDGPLCDAELLVNPWGFRPADVEQRIFLWHGARDRTVPIAVGRLLAHDLPGCRAVFAAEEGHFSLAIGRMQEIVAALLEG